MLCLGAAGLGTPWYGSSGLRGLMLCLHMPFHNPKILIITSRVPTDLESHGKSENKFGQRTSGNFLMVSGK